MSCPGIFAIQNSHIEKKANVIFPIAGDFDKKRQIS